MSSIDFLGNKFQRWQEFRFLFQSFRTELQVTFFSSQKNYFKAPNKRTFTFRIFFKKSQIKISHFFPTPQKLFLLILFFKDFTSYRDSFFKRINKNNFYGAWKKWEIFICDFSKKIAYRTFTFIRYVRVYPCIFNVFSSPAPLNVDSSRFFAKSFMTKACCLQVTHVTCVPCLALRGRGALTHP